MSSPLKFSKADARRMTVRHLFRPCETQMEVFERLRSIQFDPIAPVGCNHDLVLHARLPDYRVGDWLTTAYEDRAIYDGWDKQASLIPFEGWPVRRIFYSVHRRSYEEKIFTQHRDAVDAILREISERGPLMPKECEFQARNEAWKTSWYGPSVTKQVLRGLWHAGLVMTSGRRKGQHLYDLTERVVPAPLYQQPPIPDADARRELMRERHRAMGFVRPNSGPEIWSYSVLHYDKKQPIQELVVSGELVEVDIEGVRAHATPEFLSLADQPSLDPRVVFVAPLDPLLWDRKWVAHTFDFDYVWEIYMPEAKRKWGYYVLPILFGDRLVARVEFYGRGGELEVRAWHPEPGELPPAFWTGLEETTQKFLRYLSAHVIRPADHLPADIRDFFVSITA